MKTENETEYHCRRYCTPWRRVHGVDERTPTQCM